MACQMMFTMQRSIARSKDLIPDYSCLIYILFFNYKSDNSCVHMEVRHDAEVLL